MSVTGFGIPIFTFLAALGAAILVVLIGVKVLKLIFWLLGRILRFLGDEVRDVVRFAGHMISSLVLIPLVLLNLLSGNFSRVHHYRRAVFQELKDASACLYRIYLRNPLALLGLLDLVCSVEKRVPEIVRQAPGSDLRRGERGVFEGYRVIGSLPGGGSGAKLYIAEPGLEKTHTLAAQGYPAVGRVVIKSFSMHNGPSLPQIVRESRALESAKRLGLVLEHGLGEHYFYYVMPYVPGDNLSVVVERMHTAAGGEGLPTPQLRRGVALVSDLLLTLERYHQGGLWHKDVKPDNLVVCGDRAYLVDLGLVTPLASAMTLTTHGTEYFRDPELVRMAMKGAKVNEVDGVRFDIYGSGAVLFSVIEGSFPAHGGLSRITKRCPEALHWIVRRSMAELNGRYSSAREMLLDVHTVLAADDPFTLKPADLPSLGGPLPQHLPQEPPPLQEFKPARPSAAATYGHRPSPPPPVEVAEHAPAPAASPGRRGTGRQVVRLFVGSFAVLILMGAFFAFISERRQSSRSATFQHKVDAMQQEYFGGRLRSAEVMISGLPEGRPMPDDFGSVVTRVLQESGPREARAEAPRILFLDDFTSAARPESMAWGDGLLAELAAAGFDTISDRVGDEDSEELDLLAGARKAMGMQVRGQAFESLASFLRMSGRLDGAVWIHKGKADLVDCSIVVLGEDGLVSRLNGALGTQVRIGTLRTAISSGSSPGPSRDHLD